MGSPPRRHGGLKIIEYFSTLHDLYKFNGHFIEIANRHKFKHALGLNNLLPFGGRPYDHICDALLADYPSTMGWWHPDYSWHRIAQEACGDALETGYYSGGGASFYLEDIHCELIPHYLPALPAALRQDCNAYYTKTGNQVYYKWRPIEADSVSFAVIDGEFARDDKHAYFNGNRVEGADPATFRPRLPPGHSSLDKMVVKYASCQRQVYAIKTLRLGKYQGYDRQLVPMPGAAPESFEVLSSAWAKDRYRVYEDGTPKIRYCASDFRVIAVSGYNVWATDSHGLYNENGRRVVKGAEPGNFKVLNEYWFSNGQQIFSTVSERLMPSIDAASFETGEDKYTAQDCNYVYTLRTRPGWENAGLEIHKRRRKY